MVTLVRFEWDEKKNKSNRRKRGVWFEEATHVFGDPYHRFFLDKDHSDHEDRYIVIGYGAENRLLVVIHVYCNATEIVRIVSARRATKKERLYYEEGI
ncbi:MAG: BrnT family toxin [Oligoflexia bacterium]|nr:BrnT family toxin [Oligoflexia bacterium]